MRQRIPRQSKVAWDFSWLCTPTYSTAHDLYLCCAGSDINRVGTTPTSGQLAQLGELYPDQHRGRGLKLFPWNVSLNWASFSRLTWGTWVKILCWTRFAQLGKVHPPTNLGFMVYDFALGEFFSTGRATSYLDQPWDRELPSTNLGDQAVGFYTGHVEASHAFIVGPNVTIVWLVCGSDSKMIIPIVINHYLHLIISKWDILIQLYKLPYGK